MPQIVLNQIERKKGENDKGEKHGSTWDNMQGNTQENTQTRKQAGRGAAVKNEIIIHPREELAMNTHARTEKAKKAKERDKKHKQRKGKSKRQALEAYRKGRESERPYACLLYTSPSPRD